MAQEYAKFSEEILNKNMINISEFGESIFQQKSIKDNIVSEISLVIQSQCMDVVVVNKGICVELPLGIGNVCIPMPISVEYGTVAQVCLDIYYKNIVGIKLPAGVEVSVYVKGQLVARVKYGL